MNNFFLVLIAVLLILSGTLLFFYNRDILSKGEEDLFDGCLPINLQVQNVSANSFSVEWETLEKCLGFVKYGESIDSIDFIALDDEDNLSVKKHKVKVNELNSSSIYYFVIFSDGVEYGVEGTPIVVNTKAF